MSKVILFKRITDTPVVIVKDTPGNSGCSKCFFKHNGFAGCPTHSDERRWGAGHCDTEDFHYEEAKCAS